MSPTASLIRGVGDGLEPARGVVGVERVGGAALARDIHQIVRGARREVQRALRDVNRHTRRAGRAFRAREGAHLGEPT